MLIMAGGAGLTPRCPGAHRLGYGYVLKAAREQLGQAEVQDIAGNDVKSVIRSQRARACRHRAIIYTLGSIRQVLAYCITEEREGLRPLEWRRGGPHTDPAG